MHNNYLTLMKRHVKDDYAVIVIDNSDIAKPASRKLEALSKIRDDSTREITQGYLTIEAAVLSEKGNMPLRFMKNFSAAEEGFISEPMKISAACSPFLKTLIQNVSVPLTVGLMPMTITSIF